MKQTNRNDRRQIQATLNLLDGLNESYTRLFMKKQDLTEPTFQPSELFADEGKDHVQNSTADHTQPTAETNVQNSTEGGFTLTGEKTKRRANYEESKIQMACYRYFTKTFPEYEGLLFHVPNEGNRTLGGASKLKALGLFSGVSDLVFLNPLTKHPVFIEIKTKTGRQTDGQRIWQTIVEKHGFRYYICRGLLDFVALINAELLRGFGHTAQPTTPPNYTQDTPNHVHNPTH